MPTGPMRAYDIRCAPHSCIGSPTYRAVGAWAGGPSGLAQVARPEGLIPFERLRVIAPVIENSAHPLCYCSSAPRRVRSVDSAKKIASIVKNRGNGQNCALGPEDSLMNGPANVPIPLEIVGWGLDNPTWRRAWLVVGKK